MTDKTEETEQKTVSCPILIKEERCKSCKDCVRACPLGVLSMRPCKNSIYGIIISVDRPDYCVGCMKCEDACKDIALFVKDKKDFAYPKHSKETLTAAKERQAKILENDCRTPEEDL